MIVFGLVAVASTVFAAYTTYLYFKAYEVGQNLSVRMLLVEVESVDDYYVSVKTLLCIENKAGLPFWLSYIHEKLYLNGVVLGESYNSLSIPLEVEPSKNITVSITINNVYASKVTVNSPKMWVAILTLYVLGIPFIQSGAHFSRVSTFGE